MPAVVAIHNNMNESTWRRVLEWEALHSAECAAPKLLRFMGRPDELTPKARVKVALGLADPPFDRHDWTIERPPPDGSSEEPDRVRYVIDFYTGRQDSSRADGSVAFHLDVRPALDSFGAVVDRARMWWNEL